MFDKIVEQNRKYDAAVYRLIKKENDAAEKLKRDLMWDLKLIDGFDIGVIGRSTGSELNIVQKCEDYGNLDYYKFEFRAPDAAGNIWIVSVNLSPILALKVRPKLASEIQEWVCAKLQNSKYSILYDMEFHRKSIHQ